MVKFGHALVQGIDERCAIPELREALHYKDLKKLIKCSRSYDSAQDIADAAPQILSSPFWVWPADGKGLDVQTATEWISKIFQLKLREEAVRIRANVETVQALIRSNAEVVADLQLKVRNGGRDFDEGNVRRLMSLHEHIGGLEQQLHHYVSLNYVGFFKILKKFDKNLGASGLPPIMQNMMPFIDETMSQLDASGSVVDHLISDDGENSPR